MILTKSTVLRIFAKVQNLIAAMLAPYSSGLLSAQPDFGHPAGTVFADMIVSDFSQICLWHGSQRT